MLKFLIVCLVISSTSYAEDVFSKSRMRFVSPVATPVAPVIQKEEPIQPKENKSIVVSDEKNTEEKTEKIPEPLPVFDGEVRVRNFMKPDSIKREVMNDSRYEKKWYVRRYYNSMKAFDDELDRKAAEALKEAEFKGKEYQQKIRHRLRVERPFLLTYKPSEEELNEALNKDPRNVMYQILSNSRFYPYADEMTEENRQNIMNEIQQSFESQSGLSIAEFERIQKQTGQAPTPVIKGENLFKNSIYFD